MRLDLPHRYDMAGTLGQLSLGVHDPCARWVDGSFWVAARTPQGPGSLRLTRTTCESLPHEPERKQFARKQPEHERPERERERPERKQFAREQERSAGDRPEPERDGQAEAVEVEAFGEGAGWLRTHAADIIGLNDDISGFEPWHHPLVKRLAREHAGLRIPTTRLLFPRLLRAICEQKVTGQEAYRAYAAIVRHFSEPAPGGIKGLYLPPSREVIASASYYDFHPLGLEQRRAETLRRAARIIESERDSATLSKRLQSVAGIGPWTAAEVVSVVCGDPDAVSVGDYHLPNTVSWALAGEPRGTDERMLELLAPFKGHRGRVCQLLSRAGIGAPKYGPRAPIRSFNAY